MGRFFDVKRAFPSPGRPAEPGLRSLSTARTVFGAIKARERRLRALREALLPLFAHRGDSPIHAAAHDGSNVRPWNGVLGHLEDYFT